MYRDDVFDSVVIAIILTLLLSAGITAIVGVGIDHDWQHRMKKADHIHQIREYQLTNEIPDKKEVRELFRNCYNAYGNNWIWVPASHSCLPYKGEDLR